MTAKIDETKFSIFLKWMNALFIVAAIFCLIFIVYKTLSFESEKPNLNELNISIELEKVGNDSLQFSIATKDLDIFRNFEIAIDKKLITLDENKKAIYEIKEKESFYNVVYTSVIALIFALAGFFGFRSLNEIREKTISKSEEIAKTAAKSKIQSIQEDITETVNQYNKKDIQEVKDLNYKLDERIANLERRLSMQVMSSNKDSYADVENNDDQPFKEEE